MPNPTLFGDERLEVCVAHVGRGRSESEETAHLGGVVVAIVAQSIGFAGQTVLFHGTLRRRSAGVSDVTSTSSSGLAVDVLCVLRVPTYATKIDRGPKFEITKYSSFRTYVQTRYWTIAKAYNF